MSFIYETIFLTEQVGEIVIPLRTSASLFQITIVTKTPGVEADPLANPPTPAVPEVDIVLGTFQFDALPFIHKSVKSYYEPVYTDDTGITRYVINADREARTFHIAYFSLNTLKITPSVEITEPYSVVIKQGTV